MSNKNRQFVEIQASHIENPLDIHTFKLEYGSYWKDFFELAEIKFKRGCSRVFWNTHQSTGEIYFDAIVTEGFFKDNNQVLFTGQFGGSFFGNNLISSKNTNRGSKDSPRELEINEFAEISYPINFKSGISIKTDSKDGSLTGVPSSWQGMIGEEDNIKHMKLDEEVQIPEQLKVQRKYETNGFNPNGEISRPQGMIRTTTDTMKILPPEIRRLLEDKQSQPSNFIIKSNTNEEDDQKVEDSSRGSGESKKPHLQDYLSIEDPSELFLDIKKIENTDNHFQAINAKDGWICCIEVIPIDERTNIEALENQLFINDELSSKVNLPKLYGCYCNAQDLWIVTEFIEGETLEQKLKKEKEFKEEDIRKIAKSILENLKIFEENLLVYGNLACRNILITEDKMYFTSLLYSVILNQKGDKIFSDQGNPYYMAPEIIIGKSGYDMSADIWSFGLIMIVLAKGVHPYSLLTPMEAMIEIVTKSPPSLDDETQFSSAFINFVSCCLSPKPKKRANVSVLLNHPFITNGDK
eukprot:gene4814-8400_t